MIKREILNFDSLAKLIPSFEFNLNMMKSRYSEDHPMVTSILDDIQSIHNYIQSNGETRLTQNVLMSYSVNVCEMDIK